MQPPPDDSMKVLRIIRNNGVMRGFELQREADLDATQLAKAVEILIKESMITASGGLTAGEIDRTHFAPLSTAYRQECA